MLTPYGRSCYLEAKRLINEFNLSFEKLNRQFLESSQLTLKVGGRRELLSKAQKSISFGGRTVFEAMTSVEAIKALEERRIDIAISRIKPNSSEIVAKKFLTSCPWLVAHKKWCKGFDSDKISLDQKFLKGTPLIVYSEAADLMTDWLRHAGLSLEKLNVKYVCGDWLTVLQMVESGVGYAIIPDTIESNLSDVVHVELPCSIVKAETYYFLYSKSLSKIPAYRNILA
ncbi:LysR substrate binding domain protein [compost metagenome]